MMKHETYSDYFDITRKFRFIQFDQFSFFTSELPIDNKDRLSYNNKLVKVMRLHLNILFPTLFKHYFKRS